jgi:molybdate transport system permease protein
MENLDYSALYISLKTACLATLITFLIGVAVARFAASIHNAAVKAVIDGIFTLPLVLPPTVIGFFLLFVFGANRVVGRFFIEMFGFKIAFSWSATVLAAVAVSFPIMYRATRGAFEQIDVNLLHAARTLGLSEWRIFWRVTMPTAAPGVLAGMVLAFARGMGEFGATAMIAGNISGKTRTLPLAVYSAVAAGDMHAAFWYVTIIMVVSLAVVVLLNLFLSQNDAIPGRRGMK